MTKTPVKFETRRFDTFSILVAIVGITTVDLLTNSHSVVKSVSDIRIDTFMDAAKALNPGAYNAGHTVIDCRKAAA